MFVSILRTYFCPCASKALIPVNQTNIFVLPVTFLTRHTRCLWARTSE